MSNEFSEIIRIANVDLKGDKKLVYALTKIYGVKYSLAHAICSLLNLDKTVPVGSLSEDDVAKIENFLKDPVSFGAPAWLLNRRKDYETGKDVHLISNDLSFSLRQDFSRLRRIKSYRGLRLAKGLPVRGQRTKSNFRRSKVIRNRKIKKR